MGYCFPQILSWYQKKIGTYDKQEWEKTVEQRILSGFTHVPKKTAKLKTDLIDVDLVRGSSFTKVKPKHGFVAVAKFALTRLVLLPAFSNWWSHQTSPKLFGILLALYFLQLINMTLFTYATYRLSDDTLGGVGASEVIVPGAMMIFLAVLHSEIVSPHSFGVNASSSQSVPARRRPQPPLPNRRSRRENGAENSMSNSSDLANKYSKRVRLRRLSIEDVPKVRHRRSVAWDLSPVKGKLSLTPDIICDTQELKTTNGGAGGSGCNIKHAEGEDDGFESFYSTGSSDHSEENRGGGKSASSSTNNGNQQKWHNSPHRRPSAGFCNRMSTVETDDKDSDSDNSQPNKQGRERVLVRRRGSQAALAIEPLNLSNCGVNNNKSGCSQSSIEADNEPASPIDGDCTERGADSSLQSSDDDRGGGVTGGGTTSAAEWIGITTNSEDCSDDSLPHADLTDEHPFASEFFPSPASTILSPSCASSDKVSCTMWEKREVKKADLSVLDISSAIIARVEAMPENMDYFYGGMVGSVVLGITPLVYRICVASLSNNSQSYNSGGMPLSSDAPVAGSMSMPNSDLIYSAPPVCLPLDDNADKPFHPAFLQQSIYSYIDHSFQLAFGNNVWERSICLIAMVERICLGCLLFFLLAVAERTFKQKFLYAKFFSHLTSFRRARKSELPHFRLNKVRNIKTWLSVRSYLKKRGPQHSVDAIVSSVFLITLLLLSFLSVELLKDSDRLHSDYNIQALVWCLLLGLFLLRFMTLGTKINRKYRNLSVLITEQINLYLQIEQKPNKKDELMVANSVLKLAADLLKELECPYKISGFSANPYLYTITKVVILSALSGVLSEMLGFKLKLHKIKLK